MDQELLREIAKDFLVPLFSGAQIEAVAEKSSAQSQCVSFVNPLSIAFKVERKDDYRLVLSRPQPFAKTSSSLVPEIAVVRAFVDVLAPMTAALNSELKHDLLSTFQRRIVARAIAPDERELAVLTGIDQLARWANRLYEGSPIASTLGFRQKTAEQSALTLRDFGANDFGAIVGNGYDTLLEYNFGQQFIGHRCLSPGEKLPPFCPYRHAPIAEWTTADERRVALALNRLGEILVFRDQQLLFARRSDKWHFLTHEPVLTQMGTPHDLAIRRAVYETSLDASFARTGACIGVVSSSHGTEWRKIVVEKDDYIVDGASPKARAVRRIVAHKKFHKLDRRLRQELVAIDGATVISHQGDLLAVGSILKIPGGSTGGGRLAAAKALSTLGLGVKVSQDGGITGFRGGKTVPAFRIM